MAKLVASTASPQALNQIVNANATMAIQVPTAKLKRRAQQVRMANHVAGMASLQASQEIVGAHATLAMTATTVKLHCHAYSKNRN